MKLTVIDKEFVNKRRRLARFGIIVFPVCLVIIAGFGIWAYVDQPLLANPFEVARQIEGQEIDDTTIALMAVMLPIVMLVSIALTAAIIALAWAGLSNEKRYQRIIESLTSQS